MDDSGRATSRLPSTSVSSTGSAHHTGKAVSLSSNDDVRQGLGEDDDVGTSAAARLDPIIRTGDDEGVTAAARVNQTSTYESERSVALDQARRTPSLPATSLAERPSTRLDISRVEHEGGQQSHALELVRETSASSASGGAGSQDTVSVAALAASSVHPPSSVQDTASFKRRPPSDLACASEDSPGPKRHKAEAWSEEVVDVVSASGVLITLCVAG